jgi:enoyl-CoA hydratase/carnithine racemase
MSEELLCSIEDGIATVTMNRPEKRNALNTAMLDGFVELFTRLEDDTTVRVVVIRGEGISFCSGMDLREMRGRQDGGGGGDADTSIITVLQQIERSRHPTIAMIQGDALAGGCELALHCDLRVASDNAKFGMPLARLGLIVPFILGQKLVEILGPAFTKQIMLTGQPITARRAYEIGMLHELTTREELETVTYNLAQTIAANAPLSLAGMKAVIHRAISARETIAHDDLDRMANQARRSADAREGVQAMLEKRRPVFRGE